MVDVAGSGEVGSGLGGATELPEVMRRYVHGCVPHRDARPSRVRITQEGRMLLGSRWRPFTATQEFEVARVGFAWRARFRIAPLVWLECVDEYRGGEGRFEGRVRGRWRVMRSVGHDTDLGQAQRYLCELVWNPFAIADNRDLAWRAIDDGTVAVTTALGPEPVGVTFSFDACGDISGASIAAKPRIVGKQTVPTPWVGQVADYVTLQGVRIPRQLTGVWQLPDGPQPYWEGRVTGFEATG